MTPGDYGGVIGQLIQFNTGDTKRMHTILIEQDDICETDPDEFFFSNIILVSGTQPIDVIRPQATVFIDDSLEPECGKLWTQILLLRFALRYNHLYTSPEIRVAYDPTVYITSESIGFVVLNISVFSHPVTGTPRPFTLSVTTQDGTASMSENHIRVSVDALCRDATGIMCVEKASKLGVPWNLSLFKHPTKLYMLYSSQTYD